MNSDLIQMLSIGFEPQSRPRFNTVKGVVAYYAFNTVVGCNAVNAMIFKYLISYPVVDDWGVIDYIPPQGEKPTNRSPAVNLQAAVGIFFENPRLLNLKRASFAIP